jgi:7-cyano-7-deazaguanine synthase
MIPKILVVLSGGQDSTTCLFLAKELATEVHAVTYNYGQRHKRELDAARQVAELAGVASHEVVDIGPILQGTSPLVSDNELEQYKDMHSLPGGLEKTFVPGRNMLFLTLAANHAYARGITHIMTGVCDEDYGGYPDCRQEFINRCESAIREGFGYDDNDPFKQNFTIMTPLMRMSKAATVEMAYQLGNGCWHALGYTHTAYDGAYPPVGNDHATLLRAKGFLEAGRPDPLVLRAFREGLMGLPKTPNYNQVWKETNGVADLL